MKCTISAIIEIFRKIRYQHVEMPKQQFFPYYELALQYKPKAEPEFYYFQDVDFAVSAVTAHFIISLDMYCNKWSVKYLF